MLTKTQRNFPIEKHKQTAHRLDRFNRDLESILAEVRSSKKATDGVLKTMYWLGRTRLVLNTQFQKDFPDKFSSAIYFPGEKEPAQLSAEPTPAPDPVPIVESAEVARAVLVER